MLQFASKTELNQAKAKAASDRDHFAPATLSPASPTSLYRKASCACGGGCPTCQTKKSGLSISHPNDAAEIEADQIADKVMRMTEGQMEPVKSYTSASDGVHRKCEQCEDEEEEPIQRKAENNTSDQIDTGTPSHISGAMSSGGQALDHRTRAFFEPRFGRDLSGVRIHTGASAETSARAVEARAYTIGHNIVFAGGEYQPATDSGKSLLAHELAHVVQQSGDNASHAGEKHSSAPASLHLQRQAALTPASPTPGGSPPTTLDEWIVCLAICACDLAPIPSVSGAELRQACVSGILLGLDLASSWQSTIKAEVSYDMRIPVPGAPDPIMDPNIPTRPRTPWGAWHEVIRRYGPYLGGTLRRPDVVFVNNPLLPPTQANIRRVVEIKFPGDTLSAAQQLAYQRIAGSTANFAVFTPTSCGCDAIEDALHKLRLLIELLAIAALMAAIIADDLAGQIEDDPALIPLGARIAAIIESLTAEAPVLLRATVR